MITKLVLIKKQHKNTQQETKPKPTGSSSPVRTFISVCIKLGTITVQNTAQNSSDNLGMEIIKRRTYGTHQ